MKKIWFLAFGLLALTLAGCGIHHHNHDHQENEAPALVKLGVIAPLSGPSASVGEDMLAVYQALENKSRSFLEQLEDQKYLLPK